MQTKFILVGLMAISLASCQAVNDVDDIASIRGGRCNLNRLVGLEPDPVACFDFTDGFDTSYAGSICSALEKEYASKDVVGSEFLSGDANYCVTTHVFAACKISNGIMYYHNGDWSVSEAQSDCLNHLKGTFATVSGFNQ